MWKLEKRSYLYFFALVLFLVLALRPVTGQAREETEKLLTTMQADLQLLKLSMASYKQKIASLSELIQSCQTDLTISQEDLETQKALLMGSTQKLQAMQTQYSDLLKTYESLKKSYTSCSKISGYKTYLIYGLLAGIGVETIILNLR